jgi:hypothetical protein
MFLVDSNLLLLLILRILHLLEKGAKVSAKNKAGDSALSLVDKIASGMLN